jgi:hypothetical protein
MEDGMVSCAHGESGLGTKPVRVPRESQRTSEFSLCNAAPHRERCVRTSSSEITDFTFVTRRPLPPSPCLSTQLALSLTCWLGSGSFMAQRETHRQCRLLPHSDPAARLTSPWTLGTPPPSCGRCLGAPDSTQTPSQTCGTVTERAPGGGGGGGGTGM